METRTKRFLEQSKKLGAVSKKLPRMSNLGGRKGECRATKILSILRSFGATKSRCGLIKNILIFPKNKEMRVGLTCCKNLPNCRLISHEGDCPDRQARRAASRTPDELSCHAFPSERYALGASNLTSIALSVFEA